MQNQLHINITYYFNIVIGTLVALIMLYFVIDTMAYKKYSLYDESTREYYGASLVTDAPQQPSTLKTNDQKLDAAIFAAYQLTLGENAKLKVNAQCIQDFAKMSDNSDEFNLALSYMNTVYNTKNPDDLMPSPIQRRIDFWLKNAFNDAIIGKINGIYPSQKAFLIFQSKVRTRIYNLSSKEFKASLEKCYA